MAAMVRLSEAACSSATHDASSPTGLQDLPTELLSEIALRGVPLTAFRRVVRFDVISVATTRIQRWFRQLYAEHATVSKRPWPLVGDRVVFRWPATSARKPCIATVVATHASHFKLMLVIERPEEVHAASPCSRETGRQRNIPCLHHPGSNADARARTSNRGRSIALDENDDA